MMCLIDADSLVYKAGFACENKWWVVTHPDTGRVCVEKFKKDAVAWVKKQSDPEVYLYHQESEPAPVEHTLHTVKVMIKKILDECATNDFRLFIGGKDNFREEIAVTHKYKGNRDNADKPLLYKEIRTYLEKYWKAEVVNGMEADDAVSILQYADFNCNVPEDLSTVICSIDKDLRMVPGYNFNFNTNKLTYITPFDGLMNFYKQVLTGDSSDNIVGIENLGPVTANKMLRDCQSELEMFRVVGLAYAIHFDDPEARLLENGRLLWMLDGFNKMWEFPTK